MNEKEIKNIQIVDETRILMLPGEVFAEEINAIREVGNWNKLSHPALVKTMDWEANGPYGFMGLQRDEADNNWKLWYTCTGVDGKPGLYNYGMAHSEDGLNWTKHEAPINIDKDIQPGSVVIKPGQGVNDYRIFMMQYARKTKELAGRAILAKSKDGIKFEPMTESWETSWFEGPNDVISLLWDESCTCFRAYFKQWRIFGTDKYNNKVDMLFSSIDKFEHDDHNKIYYINGNVNWPEKKYEKLILPYDESFNMGFEEPNKYPISEKLFMQRVVSTAKSRDFLNWDYLGPSMIPEKGKIADQFYGMSVIYYQNQYVGLPLFYNGLSGLMETGLSYSNDGIYFKLLSDKPLLAHGEQGSRDGGMVAGFGDVLQVDDRLSLYYGYCNRNHLEPLQEYDEYSIGRAWNRLDGFCALTSGTVITKPLILKNGKLHINGEGIINIKIDDPDGYTLTDFEWGGNRMDLAICHPQLRSGVPYKIEFTVKEGALYSFWSGDTCTSRQ